VVFTKTVEGTGMKPVPLRCKSKVGRLRIWRRYAGHIEGVDGGKWRNYR
jgi:hypothetical protein